MDDTNSLFTLRKVAAQKVFENYNFGDEVIITSTRTWIYELHRYDFDAHTRCYLKTDVKGDNVLNFTVNFPKDSSVPSSANAVMAESGENIGFMSEN